MCYSIYYPQNIISASTRRRWYKYPDYAPNASDKGAMYEMGSIGKINSAFSFFGFL